MKQVIADKNYFFDADGNVTVDESKGERWLARKGAAVLEEYVETLEAFQGKAGNSKVAQAKSAEKSSEKAEKPAENKSVKPTKDKEN